MLAYIYREYETATNAIMTATYSEAVEELEATILLSGAWFQADNKTFYEHLKKWVNGGPGWTYIKNFNKKQNGRSAFLELKERCTGQLSFVTRRNIAINKLQTLRYHGERRNMNFAQFIEKLEHNFQEMFDCNDVVTPLGKVNYLLKGCSNDTTLTSSIDHINADASYQDNFNKAQIYLGNVISGREAAKNAQKEKGARNTSSLTIEEQIDSGKRIEPAEYHALSKEQKQRHYEARKKKDGKNKGGGGYKRRASAVEQKGQPTKRAHKKLKRQVAALKQQIEAQGTGNDEQQQQQQQQQQQPPAGGAAGGAGDQFGRHAGGRANQGRNRQGGNQG